MAQRGRQERAKMDMACILPMKMDTFEHDMYFAYEKLIHLTPIWSPDVDGDDDVGRPGTPQKRVPRTAPFWIPKQAPKWVQEQPKTGSLFGLIFDPILGSLLAAFGCHLGPKTGPGEV